MSEYLFKDVEDMHDKFGVEPTEFVGNPEKWPQAKLKDFLLFRLKQQQEEVMELQLAVQGFITKPNADDADKMVDALVDSIVFAIGTLDILGVDKQAAWNSVHKANMAKQAGVNPDRPNPFGFPDLLKPAGWKPPCHKSLIEHSLLGHMIADEAS